MSIRLLTEIEVKGKGKGGKILEKTICICISKETMLQTREIEDRILSLIENMMADWDLEGEEEVSVQENLVADLSFSSVDFVQLFVSIESEFQQKLGFHDLLMANGQYIEDLSVLELVDYVQQKLHLQPTNPIPSQPIKPSISSYTNSDSQLNLTTINYFQTFIPSPHLRPDLATPKNQPAVFLLCPSRSGSTLLRVILAGHPQLFAPPELHLLTYNTLAQRRAALSNDLNSHLLNGTIRAIMQIKGTDAQTAQDLMRDLEGQNLTTKQFYKLLQQWLGSKILVDKTPSYAYHLDILKRAETEFTNPLYIHLVRHPYATIRSFTDAQLNRLIPFMQSEEFTSIEYAELAWLTCHQNILKLLQDVPPQRQFRIKFEDLVNQPQSTVNNLCNFLGLNFFSEMLEPYQEQNQRMTDGVEVVSKMSGDLKFHLHQGIDSHMAHRWQQYHSVDFLSDISTELAQTLGYSFPSIFAKK